MSRRRILVEDDREPRRWQRSRLIWFSVLPLLALAVIPGVGESDPFYWLFGPAILGVIGGPFAWWMFRPRIDLDRETLTLRGPVRTRVFPLTDVLDATSDYYGLTIKLPGYPDGLPGRYASSNLLATANLTRWFGRVSKGDMACALIKMRAAAARGEPVEPMTLEGRRSAGSWWMAIWTAIINR